MATAQTHKKTGSKKQQQEAEKGGLFKLLAGQHIDQDGESHEVGAKINSKFDLARRHGRSKFERIGDYQEEADAEHEPTTVGFQQPADRSLAFPHGQVHDGKQETTGAGMSHPDRNDPDFDPSISKKDLAQQKEDEDPDDDDDDDDDDENGDEKTGRMAKKARKEELEGMTVPELKQLAEDDEVDLSGATKKDEIIQRLMKGK